MCRSHAFRSRVRPNARNDSDYNVPYFILARESHFSISSPPRLLLAGQTGLLSCSYSSYIHTFRAYQTGRSRRDPARCTCILLFFSPILPPPCALPFPLSFIFLALCFLAFRAYLDTQFTSANKYSEFFCFLFCFEQTRVCVILLRGRDAR